ncbi:MAG TPA: class I SAM-dependent methyltransferase, partial [Caulobacteraceae bacterium]
MSRFGLAKFVIGAWVLNAALAIFPGLSRKAPPPKMINISGSGDAYIQSGERLADQLARAGLEEGMTVVEIGMGMGGNALALWKRFGDRIAYKGFDIVRFAITWSRQHFRQFGGRYEFTHADVFNSFYNPLGRVEPAAYRFPYADGSTDLIFANSVFTHMQEGEVE